MVGATRIGGHVRQALFTIAIAAAGFATPLTTATAAPGAKGDIPAGELLIIREVGPRNALHPTNGTPHSVPTAPTFPFTSVVSGSLLPITNDDAAAISSGPVSRLSADLLTPPFEHTLGSSTAGDTVGRASSGGTNGIGGTIGGAVGNAMGAMHGALGCVRGC